jgi:hypothetical protein
LYLKTKNCPYKNHKIEINLINLKISFVLMLKVKKNLL